MWFSASLYSDKYYYCDWHSISVQVVVTKIRQLISAANLPHEQFAAMETMVQQTWKSQGDARELRESLVMYDDSNIRFLVP